MSDWSIATVGRWGPFNSVASAGSAAVLVGTGWSVPNAATIWATLVSIVFSVATTLLMRWPVMSWKLPSSP